MKQHYIIILTIIVAYLAFAYFRYSRESDYWMDKDYISSQEKASRYIWFLANPFKRHSKWDARNYN